MIIKDFQLYVGQHCETTATGSLLQQLGIDLSEPMLFGISEGLGFSYFDMKVMPFPFIGGRLKPFEITKNLCQNLGLELQSSETTSLKKAWQNIAVPLDQGQAVGLQLDSYHLEYFSEPIHFAGHFATVYGYDDENAYLVDTAQQGTRAITSLETLALARSEKGSMAAKNRSYTIVRSAESIDLEQAVSRAIRNNAAQFLNPPIRNLGYKGILKASGEIIKWFERSTDRKGEFQTSAMIMERAGTGGSLFRNLYRDFMGECFERFGRNIFKSAEQDYAEIALAWKKVADLFEMAGQTETIDYINEASDILIDLSERERSAMTRLSNAFT